MVDTCVMCGEYVPEGRQVCITCQNTSIDRFDKTEQFAELVKPVQQWMLQNYCPHTKIIIECNGATVTTDDMFVPLKVGD